MCPYNSIPGPGVTCGLSLLLVLYSYSERFFFRYSGFLLSSKTNIFKFHFDLGMQGHFWTSSCELLGAPWVLTNNIFAYFITFYMSLSTGHACTCEKSQHAYLWDDPDQDCDPRSLGSWYAKEQIHESTQGKDSLVNWMHHDLNKIGSLILIHVHFNPKGMHPKIKVASVYYKWCRDLIPNWAFMWC